jgi:hypothetical protein
VSLPSLVEGYLTLGSYVTPRPRTRLIVEWKSVEENKGIYEAQCLTYMTLAGVTIGLLMNFNVTILKDGIKRFVLRSLRG